MPDENFDEPECLRRIATGDENAVRELLRHFHPFVLKLVRSHLPRRMSEEDLTQMIFIKIFQNLEKYRGKVPLQHWISRVAVNTCYGPFYDLVQAALSKSRPVTLSDFNGYLLTFAGIARASKTLRHLDWFEVTQVRGQVVDDKVEHFQVGLKLGFRLEDDE